MSNETPNSQSVQVVNEIQSLTHRVLADGCHPAEVIWALSNAAIQVGLHFAPNPGLAFAVVMKAAGDAANEWAASLNPQHSEHEQIPAGTSIH
jgi:hypothetical protein